MNEQQRDLNELKFIFDMVNKTYVQYIENGSIYLYALIIRKYNLRVRELIINLAPSFPSEFRSGCIELCHHLDVWFTLFDNLENSADFSCGDKFVFDNKVNFPKDFVNELKVFAFK
ncbi:hypothetical protein AB4S96_000242 [Vibrio vulnificus]|nr:hypothetical protein [Vibrio vulnificus]